MSWYLEAGHSAWERGRALLSSVMVTTVLGSPAIAQTEPTSSLPPNVQLVEIVVTAQRRETMLQDTPIAVSAVSGDTIQSERLVNLSDIAAMGGEALFCLVSLALPEWAGAAWVDRFYAGLLKIAATARTVLAGGDLSRASALTCDIVVAGAVPGVIGGTAVTVTLALMVLLSQVFPAPGLPLPTDPPVEAAPEPP